MVKIYRLFPGASLLELTSGTIPKKKIKNYKAKLAAHIVYATLGLPLFLAGAFFGSMEYFKFASGYYSPERRASIERQREIARELFVDPGYADKDKNGAINFDELVDVYRRIGYKDKLFINDGETEFPKLKEGDLEKALRSFTTPENIIPPNK